MPLREASISALTREADRRLWSATFSLGVKAEVALSDKSGLRDTAPISADDRQKRQGNDAAHEAEENH